MIQIRARIALWDFWPRQLKRPIKFVLNFTLFFWLQQRGAIGFITFSLKVAEKVSIHRLWMWITVIAACQDQSKTNESSIFLQVCCLVS